MNIVKRIAFNTLFFGLSAGCTNTQDRRNLELTDDEQNNWAAPVSVNSTPPLTYKNRIYRTKAGEPYTGSWSRSHANGQIEWTATCSQGRLHGEVLSYYRDGSPAQIRNYEYGVLKGSFEEWYPNGDLKLKRTPFQGDAAGLLALFISS